MLWHLKDRWEIVGCVLAITAVFCVLAFGLNYLQGTL